MTIKKLSQFYYLNREIEIKKQQLEELRSQAEGLMSLTISALPKSPINSNPSAFLVGVVIKIIELTQIICEKQARCMAERNHLEKYINAIEDSQTRQIFTLRFVDGLSWQEVAKKMGGHSSAKVSQICYRFLKTKKGL